MADDARPAITSERSLSRAALARALRIAIRRPSAGGLAHWLHTFTLHLATGFAAVAIHYGLMYALITLSVAPVPASAVGFLGGALTRFVFSYAHIFAPSRSINAAGIRFVVAIAAQLAANSLLLGVLTGAGVSVWPAQVATTIALTVANYLVYRWWVFR